MRIILYLLLALAASSPALTQQPAPLLPPGSEAQMYRIQENRPRLILECGSILLDNHPRCELRLVGIERLTMEQAQDACRLLIGYIYATARSDIASEPVSSLDWHQWSPANQKCDTLIQHARQAAPSTSQGTIAGH